MTRKRQCICLQSGSYVHVTIGLFMSDNYTAGAIALPWEFYAEIMACV